MKKVLITGISGFVGGFLAQHLLEQGEYEVIGTYLNEESLENISEIKSKINVFKLDLNDTEKTENFITSEKPDHIYHLAALASAAESFKNPKIYITNNISAELNILEGIRKASYKPRMLVVSSAEVYGQVRPDELPIDEKTSLKPVNPYAVSKVAQDFLGLQYFLAYEMPVVVVRAFNHIGPKQAPVFAVASFAKKVAAIEKGEESTLEVGNLDAKRDFTDVRDVVRGYRLLIEKGKMGEVYNIGSGKSYKMKDILDKLISFAKTEINVKVDESLFRPTDVEELLCDNKKIKEVTGWEPEFSIDKTLNDTLDYWRSIT